MNSAQAFQRAREIAKALPHEIVTDKAGSAERGIKRAFIHESVKPKHTLIKWALAIRTEISGQSD
jgi:tRNA threonylcarbamoyladenosine modification (KEOPS) complex Cgi121 subunit